MSGENSVDATRERLQHESFNYLLHETSPANGLVLDKNEANWPVSVAATGLALAAYPVAVERGFNATSRGWATNAEHPSLFLE
jgi:hypothetical protein